MCRCLSFHYNINHKNPRSRLLLLSGTVSLGLSLVGLMVEQSLVGVIVAKCLVGSEISDLGEDVCSCE